MEDCGGELCAPQRIPFCDSGQCREPNGVEEWEVACREKPDTYITFCFNELVIYMKEKDGKEAAFEVCNRNFPIADAAEQCRLSACGFRSTVPHTTYNDGEPSCIAVAISSSCEDRRRNGRETGIDCGGLDCGPCSARGNCSVNGDCESGICGVHGITNRNICYDICPDGPISRNEPCGCFQNITPQGVVRPSPVPLDSDVGSTRKWEERYGNGKTVYCCRGVAYYLSGNQNCSNID